jgi:outer membrane protein OmpA-like peptidoglycan-associated protein
LIVLIAAPLLLSLSGCANKADYAGIPMDYYVFFETNSAELTPDGYAIVQRAADAVAKLRPQSVIIAGYSDRVGSEAANHKVAAHRTALVQKTLVDLGVNGAIITTLPLGAATDDLGPTGDRRIEIRLTKDNSAPLGPKVDDK